MPFAWHRSDAPKLVFTYRFESEKAADFPWTDVEGLQGWTASQKATALKAFAHYEEVLNIRFVEAADGVDADISLYRASEGLFGGRGRFRWSGTEFGPKEWDGSAVFNVTRSLGDSDLDLIVHELGHAFGLKHPGNYDVGGNLPPPPYLPEAEDSRKYTIMSYNSHPDGEMQALGIYDIAALQARFGANMKHTTGNNSYTPPATEPLVNIWDAGGRDEISAAGVFAPTRIDLREGAFSDFGAGLGELAITYGTQIENATGSPFNDVITGNDARNKLAGNGGNDRISGLKGKDKLLGQLGDDFLFGGPGDDKLIGGANNDRLSGGGDDDLLKGNDGNDTLKGGSGNDRFKGGPGGDIAKGGGQRDKFFADPGNEIIKGGRGKDTYVARGKKDDFTLTEKPNGNWTISDGTHTDTLSGIEKIVFTDDVFLI